MLRILLALTALMGWATFAPTQDLTPRERGDLAIQARAILQKHCAKCHADKQTFDALDYNSVTSTTPPVPFINLKEPNRSQIIEFITDGSMPPAGKPRPSNDELSILKKWRDAKAPKYPKAFDDAYAVSEAADDVTNKQKTANQFRYVSLAHFIKDGDTSQSLASEQKRLQAALDASTTKDHVVALEPVDAAASVFRIDIEKLGWNTTGYFWEIDLRGVPSSAHDLTAFDLILLENPYPVELSAPFEKAFGRRKFVQQSAILRGDWLADVLAPNSPLAADMKSMAEMNGPGERPCGPKIRTFQKPAKSVPPPPGVPLTSWYEPDRPEPFKLEVTMNGAKPPFNVTVGEPLPMKVTSARDARFILLNVLSDGTVRIIETGGGSVLKFGEPFMLEAKSGKPFAIPGILSGAETATEYFVVIAAPDGVPLPTIVRTEHNTIGCPKDTGPIWRILFNKDDKFDSSKAVRKVIPVQVKKQT